MLLPAMASCFDLNAITTKNESGVLNYYDGNDHPISPWHDVPFSMGEDSTTKAPLLSFVCEIPRGTREKVEIHKSLPYNPLKQDLKKDGSLRFYEYQPEKGSVVNYGAIAQTWEDPNEPDEDTGFGGDNDPIDVLQLNESPCVRGAIHRVRVLGALALVDDDETDWKLLVIDVDAKDAPSWKDVSDIPVERVSEVREWFRLYKTAEGKGENKYGLDERAVNAAHAMRAATRNHEAWKAMRGRKCEFKKEKCWLGKGSPPGSSNKGEL